MSIDMMVQDIDGCKSKVEIEGISIVAVTKRNWQIKNIVENYDRQTFSVKELIIVINNDKVSMDEIEKRYLHRHDICIYQMSENISLGMCLNYGYGKTRYKYITKFDDDDYYSAYYLQEVYDTFKKVGCDVVCKSSIFYYLQEYGELIVVPSVLENSRKVRNGAGATISMTSRTFKQIQYNNLKRGIDLDFFCRCRKLGLNVYSTTSYNFLCIRQKDVTEHTWRITAKSLEEKASRKFGIKKISLEEAYNQISKDIGR